MKTSAIYKIQSIIHSDRCYIGSTINVMARWSEHLRRLRDGIHSSPILQSHYNKYGKSDLKFTIIELCLPDFLIIREQHYIDTLEPYFNCCKIAGSPSGYKHTDKAKKKMIGNGKCNIGCKRSEETKQKLREVKHTEEWNKKISDNKIGKYVGENNPFYKKIHTAESLKKMRGATIKRVMNIETGEVFDSIQSAADSLNMKYSSFYAQLSGQYKNRINFKKAV